MAQGHPPAAAMAIRASYRRSRLPFARPQTLQTLQRSAQLRREKVPQQAQHAPLPHAKATTRPQQWLKGTPRPQQWLLIGVQGCQGTYLQGATSRCLRSKRPYVCLAVRLPLSLYSTPPPIRGVGGTWALAHFIIPEIHSFVNLSKSQSSDTSDMRSICAKLLLLSLPVLFDLARGA